MEKNLFFWDHITTGQRLLTIIIPLLFFWVLEYIIPLVKFDKKYKKIRHTGINLVFLSTTFILNLILGVATVAVAKWTTTHHIGVLNWLVMPLWLHQSWKSSQASVVVRKAPASTTTRSRIQLLNGLASASKSSVACLLSSLTVNLPWAYNPS